MSQNKNLSQKRILVTDVQNEFGNELCFSLQSEGAFLLTFVPELCKIEDAVKNPCVLPLLLNLKEGAGAAEDGVKLLRALPTLDYIINLSGDAGLNVITKAYGSWKIHDIEENGKTKNLIKKIKDAGNTGVIFHSTTAAGGQSVMSKLKANLNPRYTDSATAQLTSSFKKSFKSFFSGGEQTPAASTTTATGNARLSQTNSRANDFAAVASSLAKDSTANRNSTTASSSGTTLRSTNIAEKNERIRQIVEKLNKKSIKKWKYLLKDLEKQQLTKLKKLDKNIVEMKKKNRKILISKSATLNATTASRSEVLSEETTNRIIASREARIDKEVEKMADKMRDEETTKLVEEKHKIIEESLKNLHRKRVLKQINELVLMKQKYLL